MRLIAGCTLFAVCWGELPALQAQTGNGYALTWSTVDSGGQMFSIGNGYELGGTIGQAEASDSTGNGYGLSGGFWLPLTVPPPNPPAADPSGLRKVRFVSFSIPATSTAATGETALRVKLTSLHHVVPPYSAGGSASFSQFEGQYQYVGPPAQYVESSSSATPFFASALQCTPHYRNWTTLGLLHVTGEAVLPSSSYDVENLGASCAGREDSCTAVSPTLSIETGRWGDVVVPFDPPSPTTQPDTSDISAMVNKFRSAEGAPIKARSLLAGADDRGAVDIAPDLSFLHISACVDAFKGSPYPYKPGKCTGDASKACATDSECGTEPDPTPGPCILCP